MIAAHGAYLLASLLLDPGEQACEMHAVGCAICAASALGFNSRILTTERFQAYNAFWLKIRQRRVGPSA